MKDLNEARSGPRREFCFWTGFLYHDYLLLVTLESDLGLLLSQSFTFIGSISELEYK